MSYRRFKNKALTLRKILSKAIQIFIGGSDVRNEQQNCSSICHWKQRYILYSTDEATRAKRSSSRDWVRQNKYGQDASCNLRTKAFDGNKTLVNLFMTLADDIITDTPHFKWYSRSVQVVLLQEERFLVYIIQLISRYNAKSIMKVTNFLRKLR